MRKNQKWSYLKLALVPLILAMTSCENGNLFTKLNDSGRSTSTQSLVSDALLALRNRDYGAALALFERALAQDPNNVAALYGAANAQLGSSGLNIGVLISNILAQQGGAGASSLGGVIASSRETLHSSSLDPNSILAGINIAAIYANGDQIRNRYNQVLTLSPNDIDVLLNVAIFLLVDAVVVAIQNDILDVRNGSDGDYDIVEGAQFDTCTQTAALRRIFSNVAVAYNLLNRVVGLLGLNDNQIISRCRQDMLEVASELDASLDPACVAIASDIGLDLSAPGSYTGGLQ